MHVGYMFFLQNRTYIAMFKVNHRDIIIYVEHKVSRCMFLSAYCSKLSI